MDKHSSTTPSENAAVITYTFNAPRELVFETWREADHVKQWFGPHGFDVPHIEWELRVGSEYEIHMRDAEGVLHPTWGVFEEVVEPERIVFKAWAFKDETGFANLEVHHTVTFEAKGDQTLLTLRAVVLRAEPGMEAPVAGMVEGWTQSFEKLAGWLGSL